MTTPILTILVPTYNRSKHLEILLRNLREEVRPVAADVVVYVSDNGSSDDTAEVIARSREDWPELRANRQANNTAERNFVHCVRAVETRWFWFIADDDLPKRGVVAQIASLLRQHEPTLLYMQCEVMRPVTGPDQGRRVDALRVTELSARHFARRVHVMFTFISTMVVDRERMYQSIDGQPIDRFDNTGVVQLGWVLPPLRVPGRFLFVEDRCLLATAGNNGNYAVLRIFGCNFQWVVREIFSGSARLKRIGEVVITRTSIAYLPNLVWELRRGTLGKFDRGERVAAAMQAQLGRSLAYHLLVRPVEYLPAPLAWIVLICSKAVALSLR
ncbi:MAG TPA: glycosyltransferase family 2 protein, partial [Steroidobacteraceae bacterium]|nr:glycosyltransferase family 2 protein [Steroidobacteraceae bacterium]